MPTELRAALRDAAAMLDSYSEIGFASEGAEARVKAADLRALADTPPTVAELLPMVDATHAEEWTATGGERMRIRLDVTGTQPFHRVECFCVSDGEWFGVALGPDDMNQPATLVEVSP